MPLEWPILIAVSLATTMLTAIWIRLAPALQVIDVPGRRRLHADPTPRGGGIAIVIVVLATAEWLGVADWTLRVGTGGLAMLGMADDIRPLRADIKFAGQLLVLALAAWPSLHQPWQALGFMLFALFSVNVWNFMDGSNGLIATQALWVGLVAALGFVGGATSLAALFAAALVGFLPFNTPRARVFLGDCGSYVLGFLVALLITRAWEWNGDAPLLLLAAGSAVWVDSALTLLLRAAQGRRLTQAHRSHLYQWLVRRGYGHAAVMSVYLLWGIIACAVVAGWSTAGFALVLSMAVSAYFMFKRKMARRL